MEIPEKLREEFTRYYKRVSSGELLFEASIINYDSIHCVRRALFIESLEQKIHEEQK